MGKKRVINIDKLINYLITRNEIETKIPISEFWDLIDVDMSTKLEWNELREVINKQLNEEFYEVKYITKHYVLIIKIGHVVQRVDLKNGKRVYIYHLADISQNVTLQLDEASLLAEYGLDIQLVTLSLSPELETVRFYAEGALEYRIEPYENRIFTEPLRLDYLQVSDMKKVFINNFHAKRIDIDSSNLTLSNTSSEIVYIGFNKFGPLLRKVDGKVMDNKAIVHQTYNDSFFIELRNCIIEEIELYEKISHMSVNKSSINDIGFNRNLEHTHGTYSTFLSKVNRINLSGTFEKVENIRSEIKTISFDKTFVKFINNVTTQIDFPLAVVESTFSNPNEHGCIIGMQSAKIEDKYKIYEYY